MALINFLNNELEKITEQDLYNLKNKSCQSGGHLNFINYLVDDMFIAHQKPQHFNLQQFINKDPSFFDLGHVGGLYCNFCSEIISKPTIISNNGQYIINTDLSLCKLYRTWEDLIQSEIISFDTDNNIIIKNISNLEENYEAWVIPNNVGLQANAFKDRSFLQAISLPSTLKVLKSNCFSHCLNLSHIEYRGKVQDWYKIIKENGWNEFTGNYNIYCIDGIIPKFSSFNWTEFITATHIFLTNTHTFNINLDIISEYPLLMCNCKFNANYNYGEDIIININGQNYNTEVKTCFGDELLNNCFIKNTIGNFYLEIQNDIKKAIVYFVPSYSLMITN